MAAVAITDNNTRRNTMEATPSGDTNIGSGAGANLFTESFYQDVASWGRKAGGTDSQRGFFTNITSIDMTVANDGVLMHKASIVNDGQLSTYANGGGLRARIGSSTSNYNEYAITSDQGDNGNEFAYGGQKWRITPIDPSVTAWIDTQTTAPTLTAITEIAVTGAVTATTNLENILMDAIDFGPGLYMVGGDSTDADGVFQDFVDDDEGTQIAGRFGHVFTVQGVIFVFGTLNAGRSSVPTTTATVLTDSRKTLVFPGGLVGAGWNGLYWDLGNASTEINLTQMSYIGRGRDDLKRWFDSAAEVDGTNEELDITAHGYASGDAVLYSDEGGTAVSGLTDATEYFVERVTADTLSLHATRQGALTAGTPQNLTAAGTGEQHSIRRQPDTRPDIFATGTAGAWTENGSLALNCRLVTMTSAATLTGWAFVGCKNIDIGGGTLDACTIDSFLLAEGESAVETATLADITDCAFIEGEDGHAIDSTANTGSPQTLLGTSLTGYWTHGGDAGNGAVFGTTSGVDAGTDVVTTEDTHGFTTGDAVYYEDHGGTETPLGAGVDGARFYVNVVSGTQVSFHVTKSDAVSDSNRVALTSNGSETHALYSSKAAIVRTSGNALTINVDGGDTPYVRNVGASSTTVVNNVTLTVTAKFGVNAVEGARVRIEETDGTLVAQGTTNASGVYTTSITFPGVTDVNAIVRLKGFKFFSAVSQITADGMNVAAPMTPDPTVNLP